MNVLKLRIPLNEFKTAIDIHHDFVYRRWDDIVEIKVKSDFERILLIQRGYWITCILSPNIGEVCRISVLLDPEQVFSLVVDKVYIDVALIRDELYYKWIIKHPSISLYSINHLLITESVPAVPEVAEAILDEIMQYPTHLLKSKLTTHEMTQLKDALLQIAHKYENLLEKSLLVLYKLGGDE